MRICFLFAAGALAALAQSSTTRYETDVNGRRVEMSTSSVSADGARTEQMRSVSGRQIPLEQSEEYVLSENASGKVVERIVRKYDQDGNLSQTDKVRVEEKKLPGGGSSLQETTFRSNINGGFTEAERRTVETRVSGATTTTDTTVARPNLSGTFETDEKRSRVASKTGDAEQVNETLLRRNTSGVFYEAQKDVVTTTKVGDQTTANRATYELSPQGQLELASQEVSKVLKRSDGSQSTEVNIYARAADGRAPEQGRPQQIKEQQIIERSKAPDGSVVETFSVRRPTVGDPDRLGGVQKLSESVCTGKCK